MTTLNPYAPPNPLPDDDPPLVAQLAIEGEGMTVEFEQSVEDMVSFHVYFARQRTPLRRHLLGIIAIVPLILGGVLLLDWARAPVPQPINVLTLLMLGMGLFFLALWVYTLFAFRQLTRQNLNKMLSGGRNLNLIGPRRITITPDFVISASPMSQSASRWLGIEKVETDGSNIFIFNSTMSAFVLPRRGFNSDEHLAEFYSKAREYLGRQFRGAQPLAGRPEASVGGGA
jgi:hypothetical protein